MNKAFVREPDDNGRAYCPGCGSLGTPVGPAPMDSNILPEFRGGVRDSAWFCGYPPCEVAYFDSFNSTVSGEQLRRPVWPKDPEASLCACFGFSIDDIEADVEEGTPTRIRALLARSKSDEARCATLAPDGRCCLQEVQRLYMKMRQ